MNPGNGIAIGAFRLKWCVCAVDYLDVPDHVDAARGWTVA